MLMTSLAEPDRLDGPGGRRAPPSICHDARERELGIAQCGIGPGRRSRHSRQGGACLPALWDYRWSSQCVTGILPGPPSFPGGHGPDGLAWDLDGGVVRVRQDDPRGNWHIGSDLVGPARRREGHVTAGPADPAIQRPVIERVAGPDDDPAHRRPVIRTAHAQPGNSSAHVRGADPRDQPSPCAPTVRWVRVKNVSSPQIFFSLTADGRGGQASPRSRRAHPRAG